MNKTRHKHHLSGQLSLASLASSFLWLVLPQTLCAHLSNTALPPWTLTFNPPSSERTCPSRAYSWKHGRELEHGQDACVREIEPRCLRSDRSAHATLLHKPLIASLVFFFILFVFPITLTSKYVQSAV